MDFEWDDEALSLRAAAVEFGSSLNEGILDDDRAGRFRSDKWARLAEWGYFSLCLPEEYGGAGLPKLTGLLVTEGLAEGCRDGGLVFSAAVQAWVVTPAMLRHGSEEQKRHYLPALGNGTMIGSFGLTEPDTGSDAFAMRTHAVPADGGWSVSGRKTMVSNGPAADVILCFARTGEGGVLGGVSVLIIDTATSGVERGPAVQKMGLRTSPLGDVVFDDVFVPDHRVLGKPGAGLLIFTDTLEWERIWQSAQQVGAMQRDLGEACAYAKQRTAFGSPISSYQSISNRIVEMKLRLEAARLLTYRAAWVKTRTGNAATEAAQAKLFASEGQVDGAMDLMQVHGGYGYMSEAGVERRLRDAVGGRFYAGTSEMLRAVIARSLRL